MDPTNISVGTVTSNQAPMSNLDHTAVPNRQGISSFSSTNRTSQSGNGSSQLISNKSKSRSRGRYYGPSNAANRPPQSITGNESSLSNNVTNSRNRHHRGSARGGVSGGGGGGSGGASGSGKYKQRHSTEMYLDELTLAGLDIDLAESIVPTSAGSPGTSPSHKPQLNQHSRQPSNRKLNLTHLLNYKFDGRDRSSNSSSQSRSIAGGNRLHSGHNHYNYHYNKDRPARFNKQQFLQANCQFVVLTGHDYSVHSADPDLPVDWDKVEEIRFFQTTTTETTCPICLNPPVAAKITRCGHIYCWPCILHYLSLSDENHRQCPICFETIYKTDLRSVVSHTYKNYNLEDEITLRLMIRTKGSIEVFPYVDIDNDSNHDDAVAAANADFTPRRNLLIVDGQTVLNNIIDREQKQLELMRDTEIDEPEVCFVIQALSLLSRRKETMEKTIELLIIAELAALTCNSTTDIDLDHINEHVSDSRMSSMAIASSHADYNLNPSDKRGFKNYLFYQSIDGQHIYLNAFNTKVLCHEYQCLEHCPPFIKAKIIQMDWISMNETWRRRYRFLEHLPLTCEFRLAEIELANYEYISKETYKHFEGEIMKRELERQRRSKEERKRERIIRVEQNRKIYGIQPSLKISLDNSDQFPSVMDERFLSSYPPPLNRTTEEDVASSDEEETHLQPVRPLEQSQAQQNILDSDEEEHPTSSIAMDPGPLSFREIQMQEAAALEAQMKKKKKAKAAKTVWGTKSSLAQKLVGNNHDEFTTDVSPSTSQQTVVNFNLSNCDDVSSGEQSSFAKLLVDAKSSQKQWTKASQQTPKLQVNDGSSSRSKTRTSSNQTDYSDDDQLTTTRPPNEFTLADFIQFNVITSKKKGKKNSKKIQPPSK